MRELIRRRYRHWADHSTGLGMVARRLRRRVHEFANKKVRVGNIAMLHAGRCGSTVLADLLNQHPDVRWANEPFESMKPAYYRMNPAGRARQVIADRLYREKTRFFGFDSKYLPEQHLRPELANKSPEAYVTLLEELGFRYFILLDRKNHLRRAVSVAVGDRTGQWNTSNAAEVRKARVRLDPLRFLSYGKEMPLLTYFENLDNTYAALKRRLAGQRLLELVYEEDIQRDPGVAYRKACQFIGVEPQPVRVRMQKINPEPLHALVENLDEVAAYLRGTPYEWMLGE